LRSIQLSRSCALGQTRRDILGALVLAVLCGVFGTLQGCKWKKAAGGPAHKSASAASGAVPKPEPTLPATLKGGETKLGDIMVNSVTIGWGTPQLNRSVIGTPLSIGGQRYETGFGTCAISRIEISFPAKYKTFTGSCGIDDVFKGHESLGSVVFWIKQDDKVLFKSALMRGRMKAVDFSVPVTGLTSLTLYVDDGGDGITSDHADWVNLNLK
jgi:hypothetical protein